MQDAKYLIAEKDLKELLESHFKLSALEQGGVDNWQWYGESLQNFIKNYCNSTNILNVLKEKYGEGEYADVNFDDITDYELFFYEKI